MAEVVVGELEARDASRVAVGAQAEREALADRLGPLVEQRSEERRVGKECRL